MENFYSKIKSFSKFEDSFDSKNYQKVPSSCFVVIADIKGSTKAISKGKYKEINMVGAATIAAVNSCGDFPYVFGGDGASFVVNEENIFDVKKELLRVQYSAKNKFGLDLRVGIVPVKEIIRRGKTVKVGKYEISNKQYVAKFSGGGLALADEIIKEDKKYQLESNLNEDFSFSNISCRWNPVESSNGTILTLIVSDKNFNNYRNYFLKISEILDGSNINPIKDISLSYKSFIQMLKEELKLPGSKFFRVLQIIFCAIFFYWGKNRLPNFLLKYKNSMKKYSDFQKFDDVLRMVIDCSEIQADQIIQLFNNYENISFGYNKSKTALMTCLVYGLEDGKHIHFVDGNNGGYTLAAKMMKDKNNNKNLKTG